MSSKGGGEQTLTVALRIRPMNEDEILQGASPIAYKVEDNMVVLLDPTEDHDDILRANRSREKQFVFDRTFDGSANQEDVYEATTKTLIPNVITGYNATVFAYGATGAGKTHTMVGKDDCPGIMVRALNDLFLEMEKTSDDMAYKVTMSYLEIYNEMIRDLLNPAAGILDLRENSKGDVTVAGLSEVSARSTDEVMQMLLKGNRERTQEPTAANQASSRSHAVLQVTVRQRHRVKNTLQEVRTGKLFLIDLAGSERAANTHNRGKRMVEGAHINRSLLALGNCINALSEKNGPRYINYRDSKLTRLLKDALGGNCKTVMIAHISPASLNFEESRNTLVYADRAKHIKTKVRRNVTDVAYHIAQYTNIITELREEILRLRDRLHEQGTASRQHAVANIQAVQTEVLMARDTADRGEMNKLREQLLTCFKDQMELRRNLMEFNNNTMEISLETNRNQLIISEWDVEKARLLQKRENTQNTDKFGDDDASTDDITEPDDVRVAREELKVLHEEKYRTEKSRSTIKRELQVAKEKLKKLEDLIPVKVSNVDQQEIIRQMCKVHELEIENLQNIAASLMKDFEIKKKDMVITRHRHHRNLCDEIIKQQRDLIDDNNMPCPKDLMELYELYKLERQDKLLKGEESTGQTPSLKFLTASGARSTFGDGRQPSNLTDMTGYDDDTKVFTRSAKLKQMEAQWKTDPDSPRTRDHIGVKSRQSFDDKETIVSNTRNIAALAAKKKTKAQSTLLQADRYNNGGQRPLYRPSQDAGDFAPNALTPSRLAKHNKDYGEGIFHFNSTPPSDDNISSVTAEKISVHTDASLPPLGEKYKGGVRKVSQTETDARRRRRSQVYDRNISSQSMKKTSTTKSVNKQRVSRTKLADISTTGNITQIDEDSTDFKPRREKPRRRYRSQQPASDSSSVSTPQQSRHRKPLPSIPSYRKGDITITGTGVAYGGSNYR